MELTYNYKLTPLEEGEPYFINGVYPFHYLILYLSSRRGFNYCLLRKHLKNHYGIDISAYEARMKTYIKNTDNIYLKFKSQYSEPTDIKNTREYFENKGRNYFHKFIQWLGFSMNEDFLGFQKTPDVIHHIYPLSCGGTNDLNNLIHVSQVNHDILHMNPLENIETYCHQAVDYLWYLHYPYNAEKNIYLYRKYEMDKFKEKSSQFKADFYITVIKEEMNEFYELLKKSNRTN